MRKKALPALILIMALLFSGCGIRSGTMIAVYRVIAPVYLTGGDLVEAERTPISPGIDVINTAISVFNSEPGDPKLRNPMPSGGRILSYQLSGGNLRLDVKGCDSLEGKDLTLFCCCAVLTFCGIDGINTVSVYSGEDELCPPLSIDDIMLADTSA